MEDKKITVEINVSQGDNKFSLTLAGTEDEVMKEVGDWINKFQGIPS